MKQSDRSQRGGSSWAWKTLGREHTCIHALPMDTENNVKARGGGWMEGAKGREVGDTCNSISNKKRNAVCTYNVILLSHKK